MNRSFTVQVPATGAKVEIVFPVSVGRSPPTTLTFDIPAPGGPVPPLIPSASHLSQWLEASPSPNVVLFSPVMPWDKPPVMKLTPMPRLPVAPRVSSYVPCRLPSPEIPQPFPPTCPTAALVMYGYLIDDKFCSEKGFADSMNASDHVGDCIDALRISAFAKMANFHNNDEIELFYFALRGAGGAVRTVGERGELEAKMGLKPACWISFDEVS
ncbi:hypothetical protein BDZ89DRAFT_1077957, partial [Hymenopellis radicata]